jgi:hypothetical protein
MGDFKLDKSDIDEVVDKVNTKGYGNYTYCNPTLLT